MKAGTQNHLKTKRLMRIAQIPLYRAVGLLETLWLLCQDCCDEGNIGKFTDEEIADYLGWEGGASELVRYLADSGWIDPDPVHRFVVHHWLEECPEYIRDRVRKRHARQAKNGKIRTYGRSCPDKVGQTPHLSGNVRTCPTLSELVPSIPNQTQPNQTKPVRTGSESGPEFSNQPQERDRVEPDRAGTANACADTATASEATPNPARAGTLLTPISFLDAEICATIPEMQLGLNAVVVPQPAKSLAKGAYAPLQECHLTDTRSLTEWHARQLSVPDQVLGNTEADLLFALACGLHAARVPEAKVRRNRVALFVNLVSKLRLRAVTHLIEEAAKRLHDFREGIGVGTS